jgi:hypothetical protein
MAGQSFMVGHEYFVQGWVALSPCADLALSEVSRLHGKEQPKIVASLIDCLVLSAISGPHAMRLNKLSI